MVWITLIKFKHEVFTEFQKFKLKAEKQSGHKLKVLRTNNGGEYNSTEFKKFCEENGIEHEVTAPCTLLSTMVLLKEEIKICLI